mmetsp:Transcript_43403/g.60949  ORF Transcript_43403/g.60949 Transcript_43403/m.60949 type:complete len:251 (+) Transcript_43403:139-891(+)
MGGMGGVKFEKAPPEMKLGEMNLEETNLEEMELKVVNPKETKVKGTELKEMKLKEAKLKEMRLEEMEVNLKVNVIVVLTQREMRAEEEGEDTTPCCVLDHQQEISSLQLVRFLVSRDSEKEANYRDFLGLILQVNLMVKEMNLKLRRERCSVGAGFSKKGKKKPVKGLRKVGRSVGSCFFGAKTSSLESRRERSFFSSFRFSVSSACISPDFVLFPSFVSFVVSSKPESVSMKTKSFKRRVMTATRLWCS